MSTRIGTEPFLSFELSPTLDTSAYATGDLLFDATLISDFFSPFAQSPMLQSVLIFDRAAQNAVFDLVFTTAATTWGTLNAAAAPSDSLAGSVVGVVSVAAADYVALGSGSAYARPEFNPFLIAGANSAARSLYVVGIARGSASYAADSLTIRLGAVC